MLPDTIIKRLLLSRYLHMLAVNHASYKKEVAAYACINLLQDSLEIFLLASADYLNVSIAPKTEFAQYLDKINERLDEDPLPFRQRLIEINKVRTLSKHAGVRPNPTELNAYVSDAKQFLEQACTKIFALNFWSLSLIDLLDDGGSTRLLRDAEQAFEDERFGECLVECRKAFFIEFERGYDVRPFSGEEINSLAGLFSSAPYYAKNKDYIKENVHDPFDYVVLDHAKMNAELVKMGIDNGAFWNIWRLTPNVYRDQNGDWLVKHEPEKLKEEGIANRAAYVFENVVDILLKERSYRRSLMWVRSTEKFVVTLKAAGVPIFRNADDQSEIVLASPPELTELPVDYATPGLRGDKWYWHVTGFVEIPEDPKWIRGYVRLEDVED